MQPYYLGFLYPFVIIGIGIFIVYQKTKTNKERTKFALSLLQDNVTEIIKNIKAEVVGSGTKRSRDFYFRSCDVYVLPDAVFLVTYTLFGNGKPLLLTTNKEKYARFIAGGVLPEIKKINPDSFSHSVYIEYGDISLHSMEVDIHLYGLTEAQREYFRFK